MNMVKKIKNKKDFLIHPHKVISDLGKTLINPLLSEKMLFQPSSIDVEPVTRCNLKCIFCQVPGWERSRIKDMSLEDFKQIIKAFPFLRSVKIQGMGEPFLNKDLFDMISYCNKKGIRALINTNGTMLDKEKIERVMKNPPYRISFSLDTPSKETYLKIRGVDLFDKIIENIKLTVEERKKTGADVEIRMWCVLNKNNENEVLDLIKLAKELGIDKLGIQTSVNSFGKENLSETNKSISVKDNELIKKAKELAKEINFDLEIHGKLYTEKNKCGLIKKTAYISVEGDVVPCCHLGDPRTISMGNVLKEKKFSKIWNNDKYKNFRKMINSHKLPSFCKGCYLTCGEK